MHSVPARIDAASGPIPVAAGIGLRGPHHDVFLHDRPGAAWLEVHSENYFAEYGLAFEVLERIRAHYAISLHGVGLSIGSTDPLDRRHLGKLARLGARIEPGLISEHLSWGSIDGRHLNDLLPLPYTEEALAHVVGRVVQVQDALGRRILLENISSYLRFAHSTIAEPEFLAAVAEQSGCGILLDINNVYVNARNHGFDARAYLAAVPVALVGEMHLAGHSRQRFGAHELLVDTHDGPICAEVWSLFAAAVDRFGAVPTLIEWDAALPPVETLLEAAAKAQFIMGELDALAA